jgi:rubrerythrin
MHSCKLPIVNIFKKGGMGMLSTKEVMQLEDFLGMEQSSIKSLNHFANTIQCNQTKQLFQQMAEKNQQHFQTLSKHLKMGNTMQ